MKNIKIIDTTLRDGSHAIHHQFTPQQVTDICIGLEASGVYAAEVGHGAGIGGSVLQYGLSKHSDKELLSAARAVLKKTKLGTLLVPGLGTMEDLRAGKEYGLDMVRVAVHCTEVDVGAQHIRLGKELGLETIAFLMMSHMISGQELAEYAKMAESYGADAVYFADSAGAMTMADVRERMEALTAAVSIPVGLHAHNNLGLGVGNAITAVEHGASYIDATQEGLGAGCGNTNTQAVVAVLDKMGIHTGVDVYTLMEYSGRYVRPLIRHSLEVTNESIILGKVGVYSSFYLHVKEASEKFGIPARTIFEELGRRKVVGGQEDQIIDICYNMVEAGRTDP
jgi:4-hydroxy-2-oxovalerate aldolase